MPRKGLPDMGGDKMKKIAHIREAALLVGVLPKEVALAIQEIVTILDNEYGANRDADADLGGYVLLLESKEELEQLKDLYIDVETVLPEYVDKIAVSGGNAYTHTLLLHSALPREETQAVTKIVGQVRNIRYFAIYCAEQVVATGFQSIKCGIL